MLILFVIFLVFNFWLLIHLTESDIGPTILFIVVFSTIILWMFTISNVTRIDLEYANKICTDNDGVDHIFYRTVTCKNEARFTIPVLEEDTIKKLKLPPEKE